MISLLAYDLVIWPMITYVSRKNIVYALSILLCIGIVSTSLHATPTYYDVLDISFNASQKDIRQAWRLKSTKVHPDKGGSEDAFNKLRNVYETLSDAHKRDAYDRFGANNNMTTALHEMCVHYFLWTILTYLHLNTEEAAEGRTWSTICLVCMGAFEYMLLHRMVRYELHLPLFRAVEYMREFYVTVLFMCRLVSQYIYVDHRKLLRHQIEAIYVILEDMARRMKLRPTRIRTPPPQRPEGTLIKWAPVLFLIAIRYILS